MEHISRLTTHNVDVLLIVTDTSRRGVQAAVRIAELCNDLRIGVGRTCLIMNQVKETPPAIVLDIIQNAGIEFAGTIPEDETIYAYDMNGKPTVDIPDETPALKAAYAIFDKIIQ